ncbi:MAG: hydrolase [Candidatus Omnitrophica bacterium CG11_big_fil_rev_8_21_14_0_20_63_9]|nr:MAG: hydrolase [Candidatus Omnitrophica bacterium CG11_big_fil_rev_8_21_14_0_20_63_9]
MTFQPAWWCRNTHLQTIWGSVLRPTPQVLVSRARWELPDGDFLDVDELAAQADAPRLIILHGLESSSRAAGVLGLLSQARRRGWGGIGVNFRGCSGEPNRRQRSYHGGETSDLAWVIAQVQRQHPASRLACAGLSLGGNVLLKFLGEQGEGLPPSIRAAVAISTPFDLAASAKALERGFSRVYQDRLVANLKRKTFQKLAAHPHLVDPSALRGVRTLGEFDDLVTAPVHGFADAHAYWAASSSGPYLVRIRRPTLLINAEDDPFLPSAELPRQAVADNAFLTALFTPCGGHLGFLSGRWPASPVAWAEQRAVEFLAEHVR